MRDANSLSKSSLMAEWRLTKNFEKKCDSLNGILFESLENISNDCTKVEKKTRKRGDLAGCLFEQILKFLKINFITIILKLTEKLLINNVCQVIL